MSIVRNSKVQIRMVSWLRAIVTKPINVGLSSFALKHVWLTISIERKNNMGWGSRTKEKEQVVDCIGAKHKPGKWERLTGDNSAEQTRVCEYCNKALYSTYIPDFDDYEGEK